MRFFFIDAQSFRKVFLRRLIDEFKVARLSVNSIESCPSTSKCLFSQLLLCLLASVYPIACYLEALLIISAQRPHRLTNCASLERSHHWRGKFVFQLSKSQYLRDVLSWLKIQNVALTTWQNVDSRCDSSAFSNIIVCPVVAFDDWLNSMRKIFVNKPNDNCPSLYFGGLR